MALKDKVSKCREVGFVDGRETKCERFAGHTGPHATAGGKVWKDGGENIPLSRVPKLISIVQMQCVEAFTDEEINLLKTFSSEHLNNIAEKIKGLRAAFGVTKG
jgi:hypothetical protein